MARFAVVKGSFDFQNLSLMRNYLLPKIFWDLNGELLSNFFLDLLLKSFSDHVLHLHPYLVLDSLPDSVFEREPQVLDPGPLPCYLFFPYGIKLLYLVL
jgi:hypothetical protein